MGVVSLPKNGHCTCLAPPSSLPHSPCLATHRAPHLATIAPTSTSAHLERLHARLRSGSGLAQSGPTPGRAVWWRVAVCGGACRRCVASLGARLALLHALEHAGQRVRHGGPHLGGKRRGSTLVCVGVGCGGWGAGCRANWGPPRLWRASAQEGYPLSRHRKGFPSPSPPPLHPLPFTPSPPSHPPGRRARGGGAHLGLGFLGREGRA